MAIVNGLVEYKAQNKFGGYSIKVNGNFFNSKWEPACNKGDVVEFDDGGKKYINSLKVVGGTAPVAGGTATPYAAPGGGYASAGGAAKRYRNNGEEGGFPIHPGAYERALDRRNALNAAVSYSEGRALVDTPEEIVKVARYFEAYTTGDLERIKVENMFSDMNGAD